MAGQSGVAGAEGVVEALRTTRSTIAAAESLTGGLVVATLVAVPDASAVVRGGIVAYAAELKSSLLGVDSEYIEKHGTVHAGVAEQMASGARTRCGATFGVATTGVAGPEPVDGRQVGTVFIALASPDGVEHRQLRLTGDRAAIRLATVAEVLSLVSDRLELDVGKNA